PLPRATGAEEGSLPGQHPIAGQGAAPPLPGIPGSGGLPGGALPRAGRAPRSPSGAFPPDPAPSA
ncbi:hypothetical protein ABTE45_19080, partial [Acinetobacter baumannii]